MDIAKIDRNFALDEVVDDRTISYYNVKNAPFSVYGLYDYQNQTTFKRLPDEIGLNVNEGVTYLYLHTAGGRVRFSTDSDCVYLKATMDDISRYPHMSLTGTAGFDLYIDNEDGTDSKYYGTFVPDYKMTDTFCRCIQFDGKKNRNITINFPSYSGVKDLFIGMEKGASLGEGAKYKNELPIVYYGNSITQGACSSRPGNIYENIICRRLPYDYINLGFSGSGKAEDIIVDYMTTLPMCAFISDYDHNAPTPEYLEKTHCAMYQKIRSAHPDIPYIMLSRCDFNKNYEENIKRRTVVEDTYRFARANGDCNVYIIDGESIFRGKNEDLCTVEGTHPTDVGMALLAERIEATLRKAFLRKLM